LPGREDGDVRVCDERQGGSGKAGSSRARFPRPLLRVLAQHTDAGAQLRRVGQVQGLILLVPQLPLGLEEFAE